MVGSLTDVGVKNGDPKPKPTGAVLFLVESEPYHNEAPAPVPMTPAQAPELLKYIFKE
jgi:hypothetical protein